MEKLAAALKPDGAAPDDEHMFRRVSSPSRLTRSAAAMAAVFAMSLVSASTALSAEVPHTFYRAEFYFDGRCGLLNTCETTTDWFYLEPSRDNHSSSAVYLAARPRRATCMTFSVKLEFQDAPSRTLSISGESSVRPGRTSVATTSGPSRHELVRLHFFGNFPLGDPIVMPECRKRHILPPDHTLTDEGQLRYSVQVRASHDRDPHWKLDYPNLHPAPTP